MKLQDLFEAPRNIPDLDNPSEFDLIDKEKNQLIYAEYTGKAYQYKKLILKLTDDVSIYQSGTELFALDTTHKLITYYMRYKVGNDKFVGGQYVWQSMVWANPQFYHRYLSGIPRKVFFDVLLPKFRVIITDSEQTWKGQRFWQISIGEAFNKNLNVYFADFKSKTLVKLKSDLELDDFQKKYDIWGNTKAHEMKRMVITDKLLSETVK